MPIDPAKIALAMKSGLSFVCSTCSKYWENQNTGIGNERCSARNCGSPIAGDVFSEYSGPVTAFDRFCFVCGSDATHGLKVHGSVRVIGCCSKHVDLVKRLRPSQLPPVNVLMVSDDGTSSSEDKARKSTSKYLLSDILRSG